MKWMKPPQTTTTTTVSFLSYRLMVIDGNRCNLLNLHSPPASLVWFIVPDWNASDFYLCARWVYINPGDAATAVLANLRMTLTVPILVGLKWSIRRHTICHINFPLVVLQAVVSTETRILLRQTVVAAKLSPFIANEKCGVWKESSDTKESGVGINKITGQSKQITSFYECIDCAI